MDTEEAEELRERISELEGRKKQEKEIPSPLPEKTMDVIYVVQHAVGKLNGQEGKRTLAFISEGSDAVFPDENRRAFTPEDKQNTLLLSNLAENHFGSEKSIIILVCKNLADVNEKFRGRSSFFTSIEVPLPTKEERLLFIKHLVRNGGVDLKMSPDELAHNTGGLNYREIEQICKMENISFSIVSREKSRYMEEELGDVIKVMDPRWGLEAIGGMLGIKEYAKELKLGLYKGDWRLVPPAIILMGPPGTGKSVLAEAIAFEWGVPFVEILNMRNMYHGESERIALKVYSTLKALAPAVIFGDEFDQEEAPRGSWQGDSGVSARLRKMRFMFTADPENRGKFLSIYATNRPDLIDSADKRSGRASVRIPMLLPDRDEKKAIFPVMAKRYEFEAKVKDFALIVDALEKRHGEFISGADIEELSLSAYRTAAFAGKKVVDEKDYLYAIEDFVPHHYAGSEIRKMETLAVKERSSNRFLSERGKKIVATLTQQIV